MQRPFVPLLIIAGLTVAFAHGGNDVVTRFGSGSGGNTVVTGSHNHSFRARLWAIISFASIGVKFSALIRFERNGGVHTVLSA